MIGGRPSWAVERFVGSAAEFHGRAIPEPLHRTVWALEVDRPALVLGSAQDPAVVDRTAAGAAGVEVVRRRSGGGAVLLVPGEVLWVDVLLPVGDPLWDADVGRSAWWLGEAWRRALAGDAPAPVGTGPVGTGPVVHQGPMVRTEWSALACFAGVGPGEVVVEPGRSGEPPAKLVGISQRRTRVGARLQCALYRRHDPAALAALLVLDAPGRAALTAALTVAVATADVGLDTLLAALPG